MQIFYAVCFAIITVCVVLVTVYLVQTLQQMRHTARAVEYLALNTNDRVDSVKTLFNTISNISGIVQSTAFRAGQGLLDAFTRFRQNKE